MQGEMYEYRDQAVIKHLNIKKLLERDVLSISINSTLGDLVKLIKKSKRNMFVVIDSQRTFIGLVSLDDVRSDMFNHFKYKTPISNYLYSPMDDEKVSVRQDVQEVVNKFNRTGNYNMIVLDGKRYVGIVSRVNLLRAYRESVIEGIGDY